MTIRVRRMTTVALAALTLTSAAAAGSAAQAQDYGAQPWERYGSADPCHRTAGNRALTWGVIGLLAGATAGGAAAGAGVVAEGAFLGGTVGAIVGAKAGHASAACGTARDPYAYWNHPAYRSHNGQAPSPYYANPYAAEGADYGYDDAYRGGSRYEYRSSYAYDSRDYDRRRYDPCCDYRRDGDGYGYKRRYEYDRYDYDRSVDSYESRYSYDSRYDDAPRYEERRYPPSRYER